MTEKPDCYGSDGGMKKCRKCAVLPSCAWAYYRAEAMTVRQRIEERERGELTETADHAPLNKTIENSKPSQPEGNTGLQSEGL